MDSNSHAPQPDVAVVRRRRRRSEGTAVTVHGNLAPQQAHPDCFRAQSKWLGRICLVGFGLFLAACASATKPPSITPVSSSRAQLRWESGRQSTTFDAVFARGPDGAVALDLYKSSPSRVASIRLLPNGSAWAEGLLSGHEWHGNRNSAPAALGPALALAAIYASEENLPDGNREIHSLGMRTAVEVRAGRLRMASAASSDTPTVVSAQFQ